MQLTGSSLWFILHDDLKLWANAGGGSNVDHIIRIYDWTVSLNLMNVWETNLGYLRRQYTAYSIVRNKVGIRK